VAPVHARFRDLPDILEPGDLLVINTSATLPASLDATRPDGSVVELHLSTPLPAGLWVVELRRPGQPGTLPFRADVTGETLALPGGARAELLARYPHSGRLWVAVLHVPDDLRAYLAVHGRPIRYGHVDRDWPLSAYQTVYANEAGSAEMPSAGRAFTAELITALVARGIGITPVVLHAGVGSLETGELPTPEPFRVPATTAQRVNATRANGGRVVAVGTTVVRALETVADAGGVAHPGEGWTEVIITAERGIRVVDGLLTGWHEPAASHLLMLEAVAGRQMLDDAYRAALAGGYLWHEFGDLHLVLP
jgi:S-adenosylmethionine:tRNA ribosyltransferase-isomerase